MLQYRPKPSIRTVASRVGNNNCTRYSDIALVSQHHIVTRADIPNTAVHDLFRRATEHTSRQGHQPADGHRDAHKEHGWAKSNSSAPLLFIISLPLGALPFTIPVGKS
ncbi:hypothetical protein FRC08_015997 [Ceratobasidium sp. 394]|nr:hypothetical protein FRC08_015997 [Ceratobasidium sp. 394]